jgi:hypothetical protein
VALLFRDHDLSDRIGFTYSGMEAGRAAADFAGEVERRAPRPGAGPALLLVALDGENPWEHFPRAGADFLRELYRRLLRSDRFSCATVGEALAAVPSRGAIRALHAGSWIRADFGTWIGGPEKNRAWTILGKVRSDLSAALEDPRTPADRRAAAWAALRAAEGSDWFWWLDGQFSSLHRLQFDQVFRGHLRQAYDALGRPIPDFLAWPIPRAASEDSEAGLLEPLTWLSPVVDGFEGDFFEWDGAETIPWSRLSPASTQERARGLLESLRFGFSKEGGFQLRMDPPQSSPAGYFARFRVHLTFKGAGEATRRIGAELDEKGDRAQAWIEPAPEEAPAGAGRSPSSLSLAARKILEMAVPAEETGIVPGERAVLRIRISRGDETITLREIEFRIPPLASRARNWSVL